MTAEKPHFKSCGRSKSRPSLAEGMKYTFGFFMRAHWAAEDYEQVRFSFAQRSDIVGAGINISNLKAGVAARGVASIAVSTICVPAGPSKRAH